MDNHGIPPFPKMHGVLPQKLKCGLKIPKFPESLILPARLFPAPFLTSPYAWNLETIVQALDFLTTKKKS